MRGFFDGQAREKPEFHDARLVGVETREPIERFIHGQHLDRIGLVRCVSCLAAFQRVLERHARRGSSSLGRLTFARVIHENAAHQLRRDAEELRAVLPGRSPLIHQTEIEFVNERRWRERVIGTFAPQLARRDPPQLAIDYGEQASERARISFRPPQQEPCDVRR